MYYSSKYLYPSLTKLDKPKSSHGRFYPNFHKPLSDMRTGLNCPKSLIMADENALFCFNKNVSTFLSYRFCESFPASFFHRGFSFFGHSSIFKRASFFSRKKHAKVFQLPF